MNSFLTESTKDFLATETVGGFRSGSNVNSFDDIYNEAYENMLANNTNVIMDTNDLIKNSAKLASFKDSLLGELKQECEDMKQDDREYGSKALWYEQVSNLFDNCVNELKTEASTVPALLPIKSVNFPVLIKQHLKLVTKDILQTEITPSPIVKKHIEQTYVVDNKTQKRWKYPQCFFNDEFKEIYSAGKGIPINPTKVTLPITNYDIITNCTTGGDKNKDEFTIDIRIENIFVKAGTDEVKVPLNQPMRVNLSDNTWLGGKFDAEVKDNGGIAHRVTDVVMGIIDFTEKTTTMNSAAGKIVAVEFSGFLSNERNERTVTFDYSREEREFKIEDGMRVEAPYSIEDLTDAKALLSIDLYQKTYNNISDMMTQMEDSMGLKWLDEQSEKFKGVEVDPLGWDSFVTEDEFDCDSTSVTTALPSEFIEKMLKFKLDRVINDIADKAKLDDLTFVIYGNPRFISLLDSMVNWVTRPGNTSNGVKLDYGYGIMSSGDVKVQIVATKKVNVKYDAAGKKFNGLRIIPYPLSKEQFTFAHYKYTTNILTNQNSAYRSAQLPGGSHTYILGLSRYTNAAIQGIQSSVDFVNAEQYITV